MKKIIIALTVLFIGIFAVACSGGKTSDKDFKVAIALPGAKTDGGWSQTAYDGVMKAEKEIGATVSVNENTAVVDMERVLSDYAKSGNDVVIGHGAEFSDAAKKVAAEYPDITFIVTSTSLTNDKNLGSINNNYWEAGFLKGAFAALMSKSGTIGTVAGLNIPPMQNDMKGFEAGAKYINPSIKILTAFTGSGDDSNKAKETALAFISQGADIVAANANQSGKGVYIAAQENGKFALASISDAAYPSYPDSLIAAATADMTTAISDTIIAIYDGEYEAKAELKSVRDGIIDFTYNSTLKSKVPADVIKKMDDIKAKMKTLELDAKKIVTGEGVK